MRVRLIYSPIEVITSHQTPPYCLDMIKFFTRLPRLLSALWRRWFHASTPAPYRPEKHYMRGPGPKSSAKGGRESREGD